MTPCFITIAGLRERGITQSKSTIRRWEKAGAFPKHVTFGNRNSWVQSEVDEWMAGRIAGREQEAA